MLINLSLKEIRKIVELYNASSDEESWALATVVNVEESAYRRIGARMLVNSKGNWTGGISGGCLEGDALRRSLKAIHSKSPSRVVYDTMDDDSDEIGIGLGCNGRIEVLFTPIDKKDAHNPIAVLKQIIQANTSAILVKVIESISDENYLGKIQLVSNELETLNFCHLNESILFEKIHQTRINRRPQIINLKNQEGKSLRILVEYIRPETRLVIVGDNYDVLALVGLAQELGWELHIVGRKKKISKAIFAKAKKVYEYEDITTVPIDDFTAIVLMTHDYNWDKQMLPFLLEKKPTYLGMLGPKKRLKKMKEDLNLQDLEAIKFFHSPVGLDIGAESPEEIGLSILAEIVAVFRSKKGNFLKLKKGSIHDR